MKRFSFYLPIFLFIFLFLFGVFVFILPTQAAQYELLTSPLSDTVYYVENDSIRHPFPNIVTYQSWYGEDFSSIVEVDDSLLKTIPLGRNIPIRSGAHLVKVPSFPHVYAVEPGGVLRHITDVAIAENLYGLSWEDLIVDIPEVFFTNYVIGEPILKSSDIPDGILYQVSGEAPLYWKDRDILYRFEDLNAVEENRLDYLRPFVNSQAFFTRDRTITGFNPSVFNPAQKPYANNQDCRSDELKVGFIYLHKGALEDEHVVVVQHFKNNFPSFWHFVTRELSVVDTTHPLQIISDSPLFTSRNEFNNFDVKHETLFEFYAHATDTFDVVYVFTNFQVGKGDEAFYSPITNAVSGIGKTQLDRSALFGSSGKLKGVVVMGDIGNYSKDTVRLEESALERMSHELLHQWSGALQFTGEEKNQNMSLLTKDGSHWSAWVTFISPLGGLGWIDNEDGTFTQSPLLQKSFRREFPDIDLYAMGLVPAPFVTDISYIETELEEPNGDTVEGIIKTISIDQIIQAEGKRSCWIQ